MDRDLPEAVAGRLDRVQAESELDLLLAEDAVWVACELLVAGADGPAVAELAGESPTRLTASEAAPLVQRMLGELDRPRMGRERAVWVIVRDVARQMAAGEVPAEDGARTLWGLWWECGTLPQIERLLEPLEAWDYIPAGERDDEALRARMRQIALELVDAAEAHLAPAGLTHRATTGRRHRWRRRLGRS